MALRTHPGLGLAILLALGGCGGAGLGAGGTTPLSRLAVDTDSFAEVRRAYLVLAPDDPERAAVRDRLVAFLAEPSDHLLAAGDYDAVVARLADITELLGPVDFASGATLPASIGPLARFVAEHGARRGDEARVLAALLVLSRLSPEVTGYRDEYELAARWGHDARLGTVDERASLYRVLDGVTGLVEVWQEHARLAPAPEVLERLAALHVEIRDRFSGGRSLESGFAPPRSRADVEALGFVGALLERAPLEVAAVYLRVGDLAEARARVLAMGDASGNEWRVRRVIEDAARDDAAGATALAELAGAFIDARPDVSAAMCRLGVRRFPTEPDFTRCLARVTAEDRPGEATAWYAASVRLAPTERAVYDEALERIAGMLEAAVGRGEAPIGEVRDLVRNAQQILEARAQHFPEAPSDVTPAALHLSLGRAEMQAGHALEARAELEASLALDRSRETLGELALLRARVGDLPEAVALYEEALERLTDQSLAGRLEGAGLREGLADAARRGGLSDVALRAYRQAFDLYGGLLEEARALDPRQRVMLETRVALLTRRLGDRARSDTQLRAVLAASRGWSAPLQEIVARLVIDAPDAELAARAFHTARVGHALEPAWKVYLALWAQVVAERAGAPVDPEVLDVLREHAAQTGWHARLAALGAGTASYADVLAAAEDAGQRCEAHFYAGARRLAAGDRAGADEAFDAALATGMVSFYEYTMALELRSPAR